MALPPGWQRVRRPALGPVGVQRDVARELAAHLEMKIDELMATGLTRDAAEQAARAAFGDAASVEAACVAVRRRRAATKRRTDMFHDIVQDVRFGVRALRRSPGFAIVAILTLALAIGANAAIFSALDAVVLRPLPFQDPSRLVAVAFEPNASLSKRTLVMARERQRSFALLAGYSRWGFTLTGQGEPEVLTGAMATANLFATLGVPPMLGRTFDAEDDQPGKERVVVLAY